MNHLPAMRLPSNTNDRDQLLHLKTVFSPTVAPFLANRSYPDAAVYVCCMCMLCFQIKTLVPNESSSAEAFNETNGVRSYKILHVYPLSSPL